MLLAVAAGTARGARVIQIMQNRIDLVQIETPVIESGVRSDQQDIGRETGLQFAGWRGRR